MAQPEIIKDIDARVKDTGDTMTGNLTAPTFIGSLQGNADTATKLSSTRTISLTGDVTGSGTFDGSGDLSINATVADNSHSHNLMPAYYLGSMEGPYIYTDSNYNFMVRAGSSTAYKYLNLSSDGKLYVGGVALANVNQLNNYLPLSGGTMTGNLFIKKSSPEIDFKNTSLTDGRLGYIMMANDQTFNFGNYLDGNNRQTLYIQPETRELRDAIKFLRCVNGTTNYYRLYGEHNKPTLSDIAFLGTNPITSTTNDTTANWASIGSGYAWYNTANQLTNQPSQWGFVISYSQSTDIFQIWNTQAGGPTYFRSGNGAGWNGGWRKNYDTSTITASTTDLTAGSSSLATGNIYLVYE